MTNITDHLNRKMSSIVDNTVINAYLLTQGVTLVKVGSEYSYTLCKTNLDLEVGEPVFYGQALDCSFVLETDVIPDIENLISIPWVVASAKEQHATVKELTAWENSARKRLLMEEVKRKAQAIVDDVELPKLPNS